MQPMSVNKMQPMSVNKVSQKISILLVKVKVKVMPREDGSIPYDLIGLLVVLEFSLLAALLYNLSAALVCSLSVALLFALFALMIRCDNGLITFLLIGIVAINAYFLFEYHQNLGLPPCDCFQKNSENMKQELKALKEKTDQTQHFWMQILSQMKSLNETSPLHPAIILALVPLEAEKTAACLSQLILEIVSRAFEDQNHISFDIHNHVGRNPTPLKHDLDEFFQGLNKSHAAGVYNLEKLVPEAAMIFHAYCDNDNAPYKRAFIFFTVKIESSFKSLHSGPLNSFTYHHLMGLWSGSFGEDNSAAIVSRIAIAPVLFRPENPETVGSLCGQLK